MDPLICKLGPRWSEWSALVIRSKFAVYCWMCVTVTGMVLALKYLVRRNVGGEGERARHVA
jgi:hypothetical protein